MMMGRFTRYLRALPGVLLVLSLSGAGCWDKGGKVVVREVGEALPNVRPAIPDRVPPVRIPGTSAPLGGLPDAETRVTELRTRVREARTWVREALHRLPEVDAQEGALRAVDVASAAQQAHCDGLKKQWHTGTPADVYDYLGYLGNRLAQSLIPGPRGVELRELAEGLEKIVSDLHAQFLEDPKVYREYMGSVCGVT